MRIYMCVGLVCALSSGVSSEALAEAGEITVGLEGGLMVPSFTSADSAAFSLATFSAGPVASYGVIDDLSLQLRGKFSLFSGEGSERRLYLGRELEGTLAFAATQIGVETGARYNILPGYDIAPYVEAHLGYVWVAYRDLRFLDEQGRDYGLETPDFGEGGLSLSAGVHADYRLLDVLLLGAGFRISKVFSDRYQYFVEVPLEVQFFF